MLQSNEKLKKNWDGFGNFIFLCEFLFVFILIIITEVYLKHNVI